MLVNMSGDESDNVNVVMRSAGVDAWITSRVRAIIGRVPDRAVVTCLTTVGISAVFSVALLIGSGGDASRLVDAGTMFTDRDLTPPSLTIERGFGFDGQFYYRLATKPFSTATFVAGIRFDIPALRAQRIFYPLLGWAGSLGGRAPLIPWILLIVNQGAMASVGWLSGALAQASGRHAVWGLLIAIYPGFAFSLSFDLAEIVASVCMLAAILSLRRSRYPLATGWLILAVLSREATVVIPLGILIAWGWSRWREATPSRRKADDRAAVCALVALAVLVLWQAWLWHLWGTIPFTASSQENVRVPLQGLIRSLSTIEPTGRGLFRTASVTLLVGIGVLALWRWRGSSTPYLERFAFLLALGVVLVQSEYAWSDVASFLRHGTEYWVLGILTVLGFPSEGMLDLLPATAWALWLVVAVERVAAVSRTA